MSNSPASRPFVAAPDPSRYFPASAIEEARQRVSRSIQRGEGPALVIGATGLGKTMLLQVLAQQFREQLRPVILSGGQLCTRRALLQMILFQLDLPYRDMDESELRLALLGYLQYQGTVARRILLLVDEADALPVRLLEELRALTNLADAGQLLVNLVLAGSANLEEQFADPKLDLFSQRVSARCYLSAFGREETFQYVRAQLAATGRDPSSLFTDDGLEAMFAVTDGVPRLVNQLGDQLLWTSDETGYTPLDSLIVQQAWSELQQLPAPWNTQASEAIGAAVEYGELDADDCDFEVECYSDEIDDLPASIPLYSQQNDSLQTDSTEEIVIEEFGSDTYDATEQLLDQLSAMDVGSSKAETPKIPLATPARNPFAETFDSEEVVLDQYAAFESLLLAEAPKVQNRSDTSFSQQLQQMETSPNPPAVETEFGNSIVIEPVDTPAVADPLAALACTNSEPTEIEPYSTDDVLVVEDSRQSEAEVVSGQNFRQLFSSLETTNGEPCFG